MHLLQVPEKNEMMKSNLLLVVTNGHFKSVIFEPRLEETCLRPGPTQRGL